MRGNLITLWKQKYPNPLTHSWEFILEITQMKEKAINVCVYIYNGILAPMAAAHPPPKMYASSQQRVMIK